MGAWIVFIQESAFIGRRFREKEGRVKCIVFCVSKDKDGESATKEPETSAGGSSKLQNSDDMSSDHSEDSSVSEGACRTKALNFLLAGEDDDEED